MRIRHRGAAPEVDPTAWVAPNATLVGAVRIGPRSRIMYGAVLDAEASYVDVGECCVISEHAVLRASAVAETESPVALADHVFVGPHATVLGARVARCSYLAAGVTVLHGAELGAGSSIAVGALVHSGTHLPAEFFVPPHTTAIGAPVRVLSSDQVEDVATAIKAAGFASAAFGVRTDWEDRIRRYERATEVRSAEYAAHVEDVTIPS